MLIGCDGLVMMFMFCIGVWFFSVRLLLVVLVGMNSGRLWLV